MVTAHLLLVLLLFNPIWGQEDAADDPCKCEDQIFDVDQMNGTMKFVHKINCPNPVRCLVYINPLADHIVSLEDKVIRGYVYYGLFKMYYYMGEKDELDMFPMGYGMIIPKVYNTPPGRGIFVNYTMPNNTYQNTYLMDISVTVSFERIPVSEVRKLCPEPVVNITAKEQIISTANWPKYGCTLRVFSDKPTIYVSGNHAAGAGLMSFGWKRKSIKPMPIYGATQASFHIKSGTDLLYRTGDELGFSSLVSSDLTFHTYDDDPCNCSKTEFTLKSGGLMTLESPAYPYSGCPLLQCIYKIKLIDKGDADHMNVFLIEAVHLQGLDTSRVIFYVDETVTDLEKWFGQTHMNILAGEAMQIYYLAESVSNRTSPENGFSMNITAISQPHDCRCPSNSRKYFTTDDTFYEMTIPPYCTHIMCRYVIHTPRKEQLLHLDFDYNFHSEVIHVAGQHEYLLHPTFGQDHYSGDVMSNNSQVLVTYLRKGTPKGLNKTSEFTMRWHWVKEDECSCGETYLKADTRRWGNLYSPRYPRDYCNKMDCTYTMEAPEGHHLQFTIRHFETEIHRDTLKFFDGAKLLKVLSGHHVNATEIHTVEHQARLAFHSDANIIDKGFKISFLAIPNADYDPEIIGGGYLWGFLMAIGLLVLVPLVARCLLLVYKKKFLHRVTIARDSPVYSFSSKSEVLVADDE